VSLSAPETSQRVTDGILQRPQRHRSPALTRAKSTRSGRRRPTALTPVPPRADAQSRRGAARWRGAPRRNGSSRLHRAGRGFVIVQACRGRDPPWPGGSRVGPEFKSYVVLVVRLRHESPSFMREKGTPISYPQRNKGPQQRPVCMQL